MLVKFSEDDINQLIVVGSLYDSQDEAGIASTPGRWGASDQSDSTALYKRGSDSTTSAQGNLADGRSPAWHNMDTEAENHHSAATHTGFKGTERGGSGYDQLVSDGSDEQLHTQFTTTQQFSQLSLGRLVYQQDNRHGSFRGQGFGLRTDGHAAVRGQTGLLLTTCHDASSGGAIPTGGNAAGIALVRQAKELTSSLGQGAVTHRTAALDTTKSDGAPLVR